MGSLLRRIDSRILLLSAVALLSVGLLAAQWVPQFNLRQITARRLMLRLQQTADADVPELLAKIAELDDPGLPRITAALGNDRPVIALAASDLLDRRLDQWTMLSVEESTPLVDQLAKSLAALAPSLGPNHRGQAARFAERILLWPVDREQVNAAELIANCERVMAYNQERVASSHLDWPESRDDPVADEPSQRTENGRQEDAPRPIDFESIPIPQAALHTPIELAETPVTPDPVRTIPPSKNNEPQPLPEPATTSLPLVEDMVSPQDLDAVIRLPDVEVMRLLHHESQQLAVKAIDELKRRGFQARHLRLAHRLTDASPAIRHGLVADLLQTKDIDPRPWLAQLAQDSDAKVRSAAKAALPAAQPKPYRERLRDMKSKQDAKTARRL